MGKRNKAFEFDTPLPPEIAMQGMNVARRWQTANRNTASFDYWLHNLRSLALGSFEWVNVPESIDPRFIELCMLDYGMGGFFNMTEPGESSVENYAFAQATPLSRLNLYWNPNRVKFIPANGGTGWVRNAYFWTLAQNNKLTVQRPDAIVMFDNMNRTSILPILISYARRLANIDGKIDVNINGQSTPYIIEVPKESERDAINYYKMVAGNEPLIISNKGAAGIIEARVQSTVAPYVADKLLADQARIFNLVLSMLGIDNTNTEKRERMLTNEIESNNEQIMLMRRSRLYNRKVFCEQVNTRFNLDIDVRYWAGESDSFAENEERATKVQLERTDSDNEDGSDEFANIKDTDND